MNISITKSLNVGLIVSMSKVYECQCKDKFR